MKSDFCLWQELRNTNEKAATSSDNSEIFQILVRMKGLEPSRSKAHAPKACVSTNSTTSASVCKL